MRIKKIMIYVVIAVMALFSMGASAQCGEAKNPLEGVHYPVSYTHLTLPTSGWV